MTLKEVVETITTGQQIPRGLLYEKEIDGKKCQVKGSHVISAVGKLAAKVANLEKLLAAAAAKSKGDAKEIEELKILLSEAETRAAAAPAPKGEDAKPKAGEISVVADTVRPCVEPNTKVYLVCGGGNGKNGKPLVVEKVVIAGPAVAVKVPDHAALKLKLYPDHSVEQHDLVGYREFLAWSAVSAEDAMEWVKRLP